MKRKFYSKQVSAVSFLIALLIFSSFACSSLSKERKEKLARLYVDLLAVEELYYGVPDSIRLHQRELFQKYQISAKEYLEEIKRMKEDKEEWNEFFALADRYLKEKSEKKRGK